MAYLQGKVILQKKDSASTIDLPDILEIDGEQFDLVEGGDVDSEGYSDDLLIASNEYANITVEVAYHTENHYDQTWRSLDIQSEYYELASDGDSLALKE